MVDNLDSILPQVTKPARYTGNEWNSVAKDWSTVPIRVALAYPDIYEVGMSNLGLQILYQLVNDRQECLAERVYAPWVDMEARMRENHMPLYSLETRHPVRDFGIVGFTLPYELNYTNILNMLDLAGIPLLAAGRSADDPFVIGGGTGAFNPEPVADFFDLIVLGDGEDVILEILDAYRQWQSESGAVGRGQAGRKSFLMKACRIPGIYVPQFYDVRYREDGTIDSIQPNVPEVSLPVMRRFVDLERAPAPVRPVMPYVESIHDRAMVEVQRGCTRGCRFCQAGVIYRPVRERSLSTVLRIVDALIANTGYEELSLVSLSTSDYSQIQPLLDELVTRYHDKGLSISLPSLRIDSFSVGLAEAIQKRKRTGFTFAPEGGSQRMRNIINKCVTEEDILTTAERAFAGGWHRIKLYFMIGLPAETMEDVAGIAALVQAIHATGRRMHRARAEVSASVSTFIPKPHTPFQWAAQDDLESLAEKQSYLRRNLRGNGLKFSWHDPRASELEAVLARGDRRLAAGIRRAWELGAKFDAWDEQLKPDVWQQAFAECGLDPGFYARREREIDEILPWDHLSAGVDKKFLWREYRRGMLAASTPDCRTGPCVQCGLSELSPSCAERRGR
ncbi:MAG: TIGR03960 family B12-binding radical SAM protein [Chloroflexi bacterium]|nr:TIGR03960 family B12-binding radical SAM protein [Chloroflexota bacterium]